MQLNPTKASRRAILAEPLDLPLICSATAPASFTLTPAPDRLPEQLAAFCEFGQPTRIVETSFQPSNGIIRKVPTFVNEFWTSRQCQAHSLHEISYRACFKPQLPRFLIERLT